MAECNPYAAPELDEIVAEEPIFYPELSYRRLKGLYWRSRIVDGLATLWIAIGGLVVLVCVLVLPRAIRSDGPGPLEVIAFILAAGVLTIGVGTAQGRLWSRPFGIFLCLPTLILFPVGTLLGLVGLAVIGQSDELYGPERYVPEKLKQELYHRKRYRIFA